MADSDRPGAFTPARRRSALCNQGPPPGSESVAPVATAGWGGPEGGDGAAGWAGGSKPADGAGAGGGGVAAGAATGLGTVGDEC